MRCWPLLLLAAPLIAHALALDPTRPPNIRAISFAGDALAPAAQTAMIESHEVADLVPLAEALPREDLPPSLPPCGEFAWVHIATSFKEISAAKRNGAVTVWLNEQAVRDTEEFSTGFLGAAIINDFADALCSTEAELPALLVDAQRAAIEKAAKEEQRAVKDISSEFAEAARARPVAWDAKPEDDVDPWSDSIFAAAAEAPGVGQAWERPPAWAQEDVTAASAEVASQANEGTFASGNESAAVADLRDRLEAAGLSLVIEKVLEVGIESMDELAAMTLDELEGALLDDCDPPYKLKALQKKKLLPLLTR